jgi:hypothetical protein
MELIGAGSEFGAGRKISRSSNSKNRFIHDIFLNGLILEQIKGYLDNNKKECIDEKDINNVLNSFNIFQSLKRSQFYWKLNEESS